MLKNGGISRNDSSNFKKIKNFFFDIFKIVQCNKLKTCTSMRIVDSTKLKFLPKHSFFLEINNCYTHNEMQCTLICFSVRIKHKNYTVRLMYIYFHKNLN